MEQRIEWPLRVPKIYNLRTGPCELADITSNYDWFLYRGYSVLAAQAIVTPFVAAFIV
jgi:hypothetical protein